MPRALYRGPLEDHEGNIIYNENDSGMIKHNTSTVKAELESQAEKLSELDVTKIGDTSILSTTSKVVVGAINENTAKLSELDEDTIGDTSTLSTTSKVVVGAINETVTKIGNTSTLSTTSKVVVGAINETVAAIGNTSTLSTTSKVVVGAINETVAAIGSTATLNTTSKIVVGAINETKTSIDTNNTTLGSFCSAVCYFAKNAIPTGWLKANGATISRTAYANLFAAIGTTFGAGDGSTTFKLPDLRGQFMRGYDDGAGVDTGRVFGSSQVSAIEAHNHYVTTVYSGTGYTNANVPLVSTGAVGGGNPTAFYTNATGGTETRPKNVALLACIKY